MDRKEFYNLKEKWKKETGLSSSLTEITESVHYQDIVAAGWEAVPFMIEDLKEGPEFWHWAASRCFQSLVEIVQR